MLSRTVENTHKNERQWEKDGSDSTQKINTHSKNPKTINHCQIYAISDSIVVNCNIIFYGDYLSRISKVKFLVQKFYGL